MKILLAEDDRDLLRALCRVFEYNKYTVDAVENGEDALAYLRASEYDGAVIDVMMPGRDGLSVVRAMRAEGISTPVLLLTAKSETDDKVLGLDAGADDYLTKPFVIKELMARVRALTRRKGELPEAYVVGNMTLHPETSELTAVSSVRLTGKEYRLMEYLIRNRDVLLSTERIMEGVWDLDSSVERNVVWVFISSLRRKMESIGASCHIRAVRGIGYRLEVYS